MPELFTTQQLEDELRQLYQARRSGARRVSLRTADQDEEIEFRSAAELDAAIAELERRLGTPGPQSVVVRASKGW